MPLFRKDRPVGEHRRRLEEHDFYPFIVDDAGLVQFSPDHFERAVDFLLEELDRGVTATAAARELIVVGEQNRVRDTFGSEPLARYRRLYEAYDGDSVINENEDFLENYKRIVQLIGRSFPNTGIEILLHNLVNPAKSIIAIENGAVTGRMVEMGTTSLLLDLKTRRLRGEDKLNYQLTIGARQFKCTTIPIFRPEYGLVGAICINIDERFLREEVMLEPERLQAFFDNFLQTDMQLNENILSPAEYQAALNGKRHFLDEAIRGGAAGAKGRYLAAILFSDIVGYTEMMKADQARTLEILNVNGQIHRRQIAQHQGRMLKEMGDGILASFPSASQAVSCARRIQAEVGSDGRFALRIGIHLGEVIQSQGDVLGDGVNLASRIHAAGAPGQIAVSEVVFDNVRSLDGVKATDLGLHELKGVGGQVHLYGIEV